GRGGKNPRRGGAGSIVTDGRARARTYLEQQRLLGGDSVILSPTDSPPTSPSAVGRTGGQADGKLDRPGTALPPPGISFAPPSGDLFTSDPLQQAKSLDAIAAQVRGCTKSRQRGGRRNAVRGEGPGDGRLVVAGAGA